MEHDKTVSARDKWQKENTIIFSVRLQKKGDADLIEHLESCGSTKAGELKRLARVAIEIEKGKQKT